MALSEDYQLELWKEVLDLCRLQADEKVVVLTTEHSNPHNIKAALRSANTISKHVFKLELPPLRPVGPAGGGRETSLGITPLTGQTLAVNTLKGADLVLDLMGLLHSPEQLEILAAGTRMLMVVEPPEILARIMPSLEDKINVMNANALLASSSEMRVTSPAGTDLTLKFGNYPTLPEYGFADEPGHWDHWPSGFISTWPNDGTANGRVVISPGDMMFPFKIYATTPIVLDIEDGYIKNISGEFDATYLKRYMQAYEDPDAFAVAHVGWGLQKKAQWASLGMRDKSQSLGMDGRSAAGNFLFSTGPNSEAGGKNNSRCHIDIPMFGCSVFIDGKAVVDNGRVVGP